MTHLTIASYAGNADALPGQRVLVVGHSFHVPLMSKIELAVNAAGVSGHRWVGEQMIGASSVQQHWELPDKDNVAKTVLRSGGADVMTLSPNWIVPDEAIGMFVSLGLVKNPALRVLVQVSWYPWDGLDPQQRVMRNHDRDAKTMTELRAVYNPYREAVRKQAMEINSRLGRAVVFVMPVGEAVLRLREKIIAGEVPGITRQSELFLDEIGHGAVPVLQLAAYCQFACLYRRSPIGLACFEKPGDEASQKRNRLLQTIAWEAVVDEPLGGVGGPASQKHTAAPIPQIHQA